MKLAVERVLEAEAKIPEGHPKPDKWYEVAVAVYVNGRLEFHGGHTIGSNSPIDRGFAKMIAQDVLNDMDPEGPVSTDRP